MTLRMCRSCDATTISIYTIVNILTKSWLIERWWKCSLVVFPSMDQSPWPPVLLPLQSAVGSGSWQRVNAQTAVRSPRYAVFDLAEGKSYVFRVLSANKHGLSDPSEITPPIQAQDMIGKFWHITRLYDRLKMSLVPLQWETEAAGVPCASLCAWSEVHAEVMKGCPILCSARSISPKAYLLLTKPTSGFLVCSLRHGLTM